MKLVGFTGSDFNVGQLEALGATVHSVGKVNGVLVAVPYNAYIGFDSMDNNYRPYLQLDTDLYGGRGEFGDNVTEFVYREDDRLSRSIRYDFTDKELSILVEKGLYNPNFEVPSLFMDTELEIPIEFDIMLAELNDKRLVYSGFDMISDLQTTSEKSGYDLVQYFESQTYDFEKDVDVDVDFMEDYEHDIEQDSVDKSDDKITDKDVETQVEKPTIEPEIIVSDPIDKLATINLDTIINGDQSKDVVTIVESDVSDTEDVSKDNHSSAPKEPQIVSHQVGKVHDAVDELDGAKFDSTKQFDDGFKGLSPDIDTLNDDYNFNR